MQLQLNKKLVLPFIVLLTTYNVLPIGLLSIYNLDPFKVISILILLSALFRFKGYFQKEIRFTTFYLIAICLSAFNMVAKGKYMDWTLYYCLSYLNIFLLLVSFKKPRDIEDYISILLFLSATASLVHMIFYLHPPLLQGALTDIRMGSFNMDADKVRIFIPGMGFIALCFTYLICKLLYFKKLDKVEVALLILFFCSIFIFSSVRTFLLGIPVVLTVLLVIKKLSLKKIGYFAGFATVFILLFSIISEDMYHFVVDRFGIFGKLSDFKLMDAVNLDVDYDNEQTFGTIYFRILEAVYVIQNFSNEAKAMLFGNIGTLYDFLGVEQETAPHISIVGIYYLFGAIGLGAFVLFFWYYTKMLISNLKKYRNTQFEFLCVTLTVFWFTLFIFSFFGGIYYSEMTLLVTFPIASAIVLKNQYLNERLEN